MIFSIAQVAVAVTLIELAVLMELVVVWVLFKVVAVTLMMIFLLLEKSLRLITLVAQICEMFFKCCGV